MNTHPQGCESLADAVESSYIFCLQPHLLMHFILGLIIRCPQAPTKQTEETLAEQMPALLLDRSNKAGTKTAAAHARHAPGKACMDPGARILEEMAFAHLGGTLSQ